MQIFRIVVAAAQLLMLVYVVLWGFLFGAWMESDDFAHFASGSDWWLEAGRRFLAATALAAVLAAAVWWGNRYLFAWVGFEYKRLPLFAAGTIFVGMCGSSLVGALVFAITKPYL